MNSPITLDSIPNIWRNNKLPVIYRPDTTGNLMLRLPYREGNRAFLQGAKRFQPIWDPEKKFWSVPKSWFTELIEAVVANFGTTLVIQPHHEHEKCTASCQHARRLECECSCLGLNHGKGGTAQHREVMGISGAIVLPWRDHKLTVQTFNKHT